MFGAVKKAETIALAEKRTPKFEAIILELDKAIQSETIISTKGLVHVEQLEDKRDIYSGFSEIEVMDANLNPNIRVPIEDKEEPHTSLCLQEVACDFNVGKAKGQLCNVPVVGRPKRSATKTKSSYHNVQCPSLNASGGGTSQQPTSENQNFINVGEIGLKKGTWKKAHVKPRSDTELPLNTLLSQKRNNKDISCVIEKANGAKKKTKVSNSEVLHVLSGINQITLTEVATQPRRAL